MVIEYPLSYDDNSTSFYLSFIEAKKILTLDYGLRVCENTKYMGINESFWTMNQYKKLIINDVDIDISDSLTPEELAKLMIDIYESSNNINNSYEIPINLSNNYLFGDGVLAT